MSEFWAFLGDLLNPESIIQHGGLLLLLFVVFAETGLFIGFFLPGDSLIFTAGLLTATGVIDSHIVVVVTGLWTAAVLGNIVGYAFGKKVGPALFKRPKSFLFKPKHLETAQKFYDKYGGRAILIGRFLPIIRTFAPIVAGVVRLEYKSFMKSNLFGAFLWIISLSLSGYFLGYYFPKVYDYLEYIIIFLIIITAIPVIKTWYQSSKKKKTEEILATTEKINPKQAQSLEENDRKVG